MKDKTIQENQQQQQQPKNVQQSIQYKGFLVETPSKHLPPTDNNVGVCAMLRSHCGLLGI